MYFNTYNKDILGGNSTMKKFVRFFAVVLGLGLVAGGLASVANRKDSTFIQAKAEGEPNATFVSVYSDAYNNTAVNANFNKVMITYSGTAHGLPSTAIAGEDLAQFDNYILIDGNSLSTYAGSQVVPWGGQPWIQILYPKTAVSEGSVLEIKEGTTFGDAIFNQAALKLNSSAKWVYYFNEAVNSYYSKIYNDDYNNTAVNANYNKVMIVYTGVAHGVSSAITGNDLKKYDAYVTIDGNPISVNPASQISPWGGQLWITFIYSVSAISEGSVLEIKEGTKVGNAVLDGFTLKLNGSKWAYTFNEPVNSYYSKIYNDDYNNTAVNASYNKVMIVYTGVAHGASGAITGNDLRKYDAYVTINGNPISADLGSQISPWGGQLWITFIYPSSAVSAGSKLVVKDGTKVGNAVLGGFTLELNSSAKWEKLALIADEDLVANGDYLLFTPSDYSISGNASIPFYKDLGSVFTNSFGVQFKINIPSADLATTTVAVNMACTNIYGSSPLFDLRLNDGTYIFGFFCNGNYDWNTYNKSPNWTGDVDHLIEFYGIRTDSTHMTFFFGFDGILIWKTNSTDISAISFEGHTFFNVTNKGSTTTSTFSSEPTVEKVLTRFASKKIMYGSVPFTNTSDTGACRGENGYYAKAKTFYNTFLTPNQKVAFASESAYAQLRERMIAWGAANGETISFNASTGELVISSNSNIISLFANNDTNKSMIFIIALVSLLGVSFIVFFIIKKKKAAK